MVNLLVDLNKERRKGKTQCTGLFLICYDYYFNALLTLENKNCRQEKKNEEYPCIRFVSN